MFIFRFSRIVVRDLRFAAILHFSFRIPRSSIILHLRPAALQRFSRIAALFSKRHYFPALPLCTYAPLSAAPGAPRPLPNRRNRPPPPPTLPREAVMIDLRPSRKIGTRVSNLVSIFAAAARIRLTFRRSFQIDRIPVYLRKRSVDRGSGKGVLSVVQQCLTLLSLRSLHPSQYF